MENLEPHKYDLREKAKTELSQEKQEESRIEFSHSIIPHNGHTLFEINPINLEIKEAEYEQQDIVFDPNWKKGDKIKQKRKVIMNDGMIYISALNKNNALKKFKKGNNGSK